MAVVRTGGAFGAEIVVDGLGAVRNALYDIDPALRRRFDRDLKKAIDTVAQTAAREVDSRTGDTAAGYKVTRRGDTFKITNKTLGALILEFWNAPRCPQGEHLIATLNEKYGSPGRVLWGSWDAMNGWVLDQVRDIVDDAEFEIQKQLDAA